MHISVRRLTHLARWITPALAGVGALAAALTDATADRSERLLLGAALTAIAFTALPRSRRSDLLTAVIAYSGCLLLLDHMKEGLWRLDTLFACQAGALLVFACSCLEKVRWLARSEPSADLGQIYPTRHRRLSSATPASSPLPTLSPRAGGTGPRQHRRGAQEASRSGSRAIGFMPTP